MNVDEEIRPAGAATEVAGVVVGVVEKGVEGAVGDAATNGLVCRHLFGQEVDGAAEGRGADGGGGTGAAIEVDAADPLRGEEGPGVVGGAVGVVEGDAVEGDVVVAVGEAAEVGLAVAEADAVGVDAEGAGRHLKKFAVVGDGRGEILYEGGADLGSRGACLEKAVHGRELGRDGVGVCRLDGDLIGCSRDTEGEGYVLRLVGGELEAPLDGGCEAGGGGLDRVLRDGEAGDGEVTLGVGGGLAGDAGGLALHGDSGVLKDVAFGIEDGSGEVAGLLRVQRY